MTHLQLEAWVLQILARVEAKQPLEDSRIECKTDWQSNSYKSARQLGGHANAAIGGPILWLIGVDERSGRISGAAQKELSNWHSEVNSHFDGIAPTLETSLVIPWKSVSIVALLFATDRAPFVVKVPNGQTISHEVPWNEGTRVRSAKREDLIRLLAPMSTLPTMDVVEGSLSARGTPFELGLTLFIVAREMITIPFYSCAVTVKRNGLEIVKSGSSVRMKPYVDRQRRDYRGIHVGGGPDPRDASATVHASDGEIVLSGPGTVHLSATIYPKPDAHDSSTVTGPLDVQFRFIPAGSAIPLTITVPFSPHFGLNGVAVAGEWRFERQDGTGL